MCMLAVNQTLSLSIHAADAVRSFIFGAKAAALWTGRGISVRSWILHLMCVMPSCIFSSEWTLNAGFCKLTFYQKHTRIAKSHTCSLLNVIWKKVTCFFWLLLLKGRDRLKRGKVEIGHRTVWRWNQIKMMACIVSFPIMWKIKFQKKVSVFKRLIQ